MEIGKDLDFVRCYSDPDNPLPLILEARDHTSVENLADWLRSNETWVHEKLVNHGALLLRGFAMHSAEAFGAVCRAVSPDLRSSWVGTPGTRLASDVYPASEGPTEYPIPSHCELMYLPEPPKMIFFGCLVPPEPDSGETPLVDNRRVWNELAPELRERFGAAEGIRIVRHLSGPKTRRRLWTLVRWDDYFVTTDRARVEAQCREVDFDFEWLSDDRLRLEFVQPVTRVHPISGETAWCNQLLSYDATSTAHDFARLYARRPSFRLWKMWQFVRTTAQFKKRSPVSTLPAHCTFADGSPISDADRNAVRDAVWNNLSYQPWQTGDVLAVDNFATGHARFPAWNRRKIVAAMA
jgi:hypothetical protein